MEHSRVQRALRLTPTLRHSWGWWGCHHLQLFLLRQLIQGHLGSCPERRWLCCAIWECLFAPRHWSSWESLSLLVSFALKIQAVDRHPVSWSLIVARLSMCSLFKWRRVTSNRLPNSSELSCKMEITILNSQFSCEEYNLRHSGLEDCDTFCFTINSWCCCLNKVPLKYKTIFFVSRSLVAKQNQIFMLVVCCWIHCGMNRIEI